MLAEKIDNIGPTYGDGSMGKVDNKQRDILVQVSLRLFHERGYGKVKFSDIARAAGLTTKEVQRYFSSLQEICHQVIEVHLDNQAAQFDEISQNNNPRQRLSLYLDSLSESADMLIVRGCPVTNLYFDVKREKKELADHAAQLLQQRLEWIRKQFVLITRVEDTKDLPERLTSAIHGISIVAQATGNTRLIRSQVNQLKSWIRSM